MIDDSPGDRPITDEDEFWLGPFSIWDINTNTGEAYISWPNLKYWLDQ